jgi:hypothetical protein
MTAPLISVDIQSAAALRLLTSAPAGLARALDGTLNDASALMLRELRTYPPQRAGSTYIRRKMLDRSWSRQFSGSGLERSVVVGSNENIAPYNREVQDAERQAKVHKGRWRNTVQAVAKNNERHIGNMLEDRVQAEIRRLGG